MTDTKYATAKEIPAELRDEVHQAVIDLIKASVAACADRNDRYLDYDNQLRGWGLTATRPRWENGSLLEDPLTREHHTELYSAMLQTLRQPTQWLVEATDDADEDLASTVEEWINAKAQEVNIPQKHAPDAAYVALAQPKCPLYCGWRQEFETEREIAYRPIGKKTAQPIPAEQRDPAVEYEEVTLIREGAVTYDGLDIRLVQPVDYYYSPANAKDMDQANGVIERLWYLDGDLLDGVDENGFDEDQVSRLLLLGPTHVYTDNDWKKDHADRAGVNVRQSAFYEVFQYYGRLPSLIDEDGKSRIPSDIRKQDFCFMCCIEHEICFKGELAPYQMRPYTEYKCYPIPGEADGECIASLLRPLQVEATHNIRFIGDCKDLIASPGQYVPMSNRLDYSVYQIYPGCQIPFNAGQGKPEPIQWSADGLNFAMEYQQDIRTRGAQLVSSQATQLQPKRRQATEINAALSSTNQKYDMVLSNFQASGHERLGQLIIMHYAQREGGDTAYANGNSVSVSQQDLSRRFRLVPHANSDNANPQLRLQRVEMLVQAVRTSPLYQQWITSGDMTHEWQMLARVIAAAGERNVKAWIGGEPEAPPDPESMLSMIMKAAQAAAQHGDPFAQQVLQQIQQMTQQLVSQGGQQGAPMLSAQATPPPQVMPQTYAPPANTNGAMPQMAGAVQ